MFKITVTCITVIRGVLFEEILDIQNNIRYYVLTYYNLNSKPVESINSTYNKNLGVH